MNVSDRDLSEFVAAVGRYKAAWLNGFDVDEVNKIARAIVNVVDRWHSHGSAEQLLSDLLRHEDPYVQGAAATSLVRLKMPGGAVPVLEELARNGPGRTALDAKLILLVLRDTNKGLESEQSRS